MDYLHANEGSREKQTAGSTYIIRQLPVAEVAEDAAVIVCSAKFALPERAGHKLACGVGGSVVIQALIFASATSPQGR
eukprot:6191059-Pleurochrysis_carterae.AAC.1